MAAYTRNERWRPRRGKPRPIDHGSRPANRSSDTSSFVFKDLEENLDMFSVDDATEETVRLRHVTPVASYSWIDAPVPTIAVPGSPRIWIERSGPVKQVPLDAGVHYIHHDASKMGNRSPMLPFFAAIDAMHDDFPYAEIDLLTDRNALRKLLRYVDRVRTEDSFRIDLDVVGKTCLFTRQEENAAVVGQQSGYGNEYLRAATRPPLGCEKMLDHRRIITYKFGSLKILLGFASDACVEQSVDDELLVSMSSLSIGGKAEKAAGPGKSGLKGELHVRHAPSCALVPQSDLIEVKTRSVHREPNWREIYPQLYLSQTAWFYAATHSGGVFEPVKKIALTGEEMQPYAALMEGSLGKLKQLLKAILKAARKQGEGVPMSLVHHAGTLALWRRKGGAGKPLGEEIISRFKRTAVL